MSAPVRKVAAYVPMTREMVNDDDGLRRVVDRHMDDLAFALAVGRGRLTETSAITMWRRWSFVRRRNERTS